MENLFDMSLCSVVTRTWFVSMNIFMSLKFLNLFIHVNTYVYV